MATQEVTIRPPQAMNRFEQREVIDTIKQTVCKGATDAQLRMFLEVCKATGLDPFLKEIWYVAEKGIIMAARDGYLRVANEHPQFDGIETRVERDNNKIPIKAVCTVWRKDRNHPVICEAYFNEYNKPSPVWKQYPSAMISKVAEVLALKRSFAINGVVTEEEIGEQGQGSREAQLEVRDRKLAEIRQRQQSAAPTEVIDAEVVEEPTSEPTELPGESQARRLLTVDEFRSCNKAEQIKAFGLMKAAIGDPDYYRILGVVGVEHANEFRTLGEARKAYAEMRETYNFMQSQRAI